MNHISIVLGLFVILLGIFIYYSMNGETFSTSKAPLMFNPQLRHTRYQDQEHASVDEIMYGYRTPNFENCCD